MAAGRHIEASGVCQQCPKGTAQVKTTARHAGESVDRWRSSERTERCRCWRKVAVVALLHQSLQLSRQQSPRHHHTSTSSCCFTVEPHLQTPSAHLLWISQRHDSREQELQTKTLEGKCEVEPSSSGVLVVSSLKGESHSAFSSCLQPLVRFLTYEREKPRPRRRWLSVL